MSAGNKVNIRNWNFQPIGGRCTATWYLLPSPKIILLDPPCQYYSSPLTMQEGLAFLYLRLGKGLVVGPDRLRQVKLAASTCLQFLCQRRVFYRASHSYCLPGLKKGCHRKYTSISSAHCSPRTFVEYVLAMLLIRVSF